MIGTVLQGAHFEDSISTFPRNSDGATLTLIAALPAILRDISIVADLEGANTKF